MLGRAVDVTTAFRPSCPFRVMPGPRERRRHCWVQPHRPGNSTATAASNVPVEITRW